MLEAGLVVDDNVWVLSRCSVLQIICKKDGRREQGMYAVLIAISQHGSHDTVRK